MKEVSIISKIVGRAVDSMRMPSAAPAASVDLSGYLPKSVWDAVWEVRETDEGTRYVLGKLPVVLRYGLTMYADDGDVDLPGIYDGLPIDNQTLYWVTDENGEKVMLKAKGGGSGEGGGIEYPLTWSGYSSGTWDGSTEKNIYIPSKVSELSNDSAFITSSALNGYATESYVTSRGYITASALNGYATESWVKNQGYALASALGKYLPLTGGTITGNLTVNDTVYCDVYRAKNGRWLFGGGDTAIAFGGYYAGVTTTFNGETLKFYVASNEMFVIDSNGGTFRKNLLVSGGITMYSDERKKTILNHVQLSLREVADAPLIEHYYNSDTEKTTHVGSIAQYWAGLNDWFCKMDADGFYTMEVQNAALASAISVARELLKYETKTDKQIRKMKKRISELEEEVELLKKM